MLAEKLGIRCSDRCELLIAFSYLRDGTDVVRLANCLANDENQSAIQLARALIRLPEQEAKNLSARVLESKGLNLKEQVVDIMVQLKNAIRREER